MYMIGCIRLVLQQCESLILVFFRTALLYHYFYLNPLPYDSDFPVLLPVIIHFPVPPLLTFRSSRVLFTGPLIRKTPTPFPVSPATLKRICETVRERITSGAAAA